MCRDTQLTLTQCISTFILLLYSVDKDDWDDYDEDEDDDDDDDDDEKGLIEANDGDVEDGAKLRHCEGDCDSGKFVSGALCKVHPYIHLSSVLFNLT